MRVSADLSSKIAFLSHFGKMRPESTPCGSVMPLTYLVIINQIGQYLKSRVLNIIILVNNYDSFSQFSLGFILTEMRAMLYDIVLQNMNI